jgi:hypothetical protein
MARARSDDASFRAARALLRVSNSGSPVTFAAVAQEAGVSTNFLYRNETLRANIERARRGEGARSSPDSPEPERSGATVKLAVALRALEEARKEATILREENARLHGQISALRTRLRER